MYNHFAASQVVEIPVPDESISIKQYLRQPHRFVKAMGDANRIEQISHDRFSLKMRPLQFFSLKIEPIVEILIWADNEGTVNLKSVACQLRGIETINEHFNLQVSGTMKPLKMGNKTYLKGGAELGLKIFLPPPFSFMPKSVLASTGNALLSSILLKMKRKLMEQMLSDYCQWVREQTKHKQLVGF